MNLTDAELNILDDCITEANYACLKIVTGEREGDKAWAERRHIELVQLRQKLGRIIEAERRRNNTKTPEEAWKSAVKQMIGKSLAEAILEAIEN